MMTGVPTCGGVCGFNDGDCFPAADGTAVCSRPSPSSQAARVGVLLTIWIVGGVNFRLEFGISFMWLLVDESELDGLTGPKLSEAIRFSGLTVLPESIPKERVDDFAVIRETSGLPLLASSLFVRTRRRRIGGESTD